MVRAGVHGFVPKQEPVFAMFEAIDAVLAGEPGLSELAAIWETTFR
jgi:DNA-binding NarL/FixJ family response regulator